MQELATINNTELNTRELFTDDEILDYFFAQLTEHTEKTVQTYKRNIKPFVAYLYEIGLNLRTATHQTITGYKQSLRKQGKKPATINGYLSAVRALYKVLSSNGVCANIADNIKNEKIHQQGAKNALSKEQAQMLLEQPKDGASLKQLRDSAIITLCMLTGLRTIEVARANIGDLEQKQGRETLNIQGKGHNAKDDFVVLELEVYRPLMKYLNARKCTDPKAPLFASVSNNNAGGRMTTTAISALIKQAMKNHGINDAKLTAHSLRHSAVTFALLDGKTPQQAQKLARHANINTTLIYAHNIDKLENEAGKGIIHYLYSA